MNITRYELLPGVWLTHALRDGADACLSFDLLAQTDRETASVNALLPYVLRCGTANESSFDALTAALAAFGASAKPKVRRVGEIQCVGIVITMPSVSTAQAVELMGRILLNPATRGGLLLPGHVEAEREKLAGRIAEAEEYSPEFALHRCIEHTCCYEDYCVSPLGDEEGVLGVYYRKLTKQYRALLQSAPVEIFYSGGESAKTVRALLKDALMTFPRGEVDYELGTDVRMNAVEEEPRRVTELLSGAQEETLMAFRLGECMEEPDLAALMIFAKLFSGTRLLDVHKGLWIVSAASEEEMFSALRELADRGPDPEELEKARAAVMTELRECMDDPEKLEDFCLGQVLDGLDLGPDELAALCEDTQGADIAEVARSVECDLIYTLTPEGD